MTQSLTTTIYTGITLTATGAYQSPFTITATGDVAPAAGSSAGVYSALVGVTLVNDGLIDTVGNATYGVSLNNGGYVSNHGTITGNLTGVGIAAGTAGTVTNTGTITGSGSFGVQIFDSGTVTNGAQGVITGGRAGLNLDAGTIVVTNAGMISGSSKSGVELDTSGTVTNVATGLIQGPIGVNVGYGAVGTVVNAGTISGTTDAINFGYGAGSMLVVDPGAVFIGKVVAGSSSTSDVLALGAGTGTISGIASSGTAGSFNGFQTIAFDTGAAWTAAGAYAGLNHEVVTGFTLGDTIVLDGFGATSDTYVSGTGLELSNGTTSVTLDITGNFTTADFSVVGPALNTSISSKNPCFVAGTKILTREGEVAVEDLAEGDAAVLADGTMAPIIWIGHRKVQPRAHRKPETVLPVLIEAGALAVGVPCRDLLVSPDHALFLAGHLIPAKALINGATIRQVWRESVTYYHVELASHAVLLAEATPAESYLESGNRDAFANGGAAMVLHPDFAQTYRETAGCAPFSECGPVVEAVRADILGRAAIPTTDDPDLTVRYRPDGSAMILSRAAIPGNLAADPRDRRRLGVKIASIVCGGRTLALDDPALIEGWHDAEPDGRWTDGAAVIPAHLIGGELVQLTLAAATRYPVAEGADRFVGMAG